MNCNTCIYLMVGYSGDGWNEPREEEIGCKILNEGEVTEGMEDMILEALEQSYNDEQHNCTCYDPGKCFVCGEQISKDGPVYEVMGYYENHNTCSKECYEVGTLKEREYVREMMS